MSYTRINGMRSARYPLQGHGCVGCAPGVGTVAETAGGTALIAVIVLGTIGAIVLKAPKPRRNRRHRRTSRRRR